MRPRLARPLRGPCRRNAHNSSDSKVEGASGASKSHGESHGHGHGHENVSADEPVGVRSIFIIKNIDIYSSSI